MKKLYLDELIIQILLLVMILACVYGRMIHLWWMYDDLIVLSLLNDTALQYFYIPLEKIGWIPANFTPLLFLDYWIDFKLFNLNPLGAFIHHLAAICMVSIVTLMLARKIFGSYVSFVFVTFFFLSNISHTVSFILCQRHYVYGLGYICFSLILYYNFKKNDKIYLLILSSFFYFISCLYKEIYVPVSLLIMYDLFIDSISKKNIKQLYYCAPYLIVLMIYFIYRTYALGFDNLFSGYKSAHDGLIEIYRYVDLFFDISFINLYYYVPAILVVGVVWILTSFNFTVFIKNFSFLIIIMAIIIIPIYKVMPYANANYNYYFLFNFAFLFINFFVLNMFFNICKNKSVYLLKIMLIIFIAYSLKMNIPNYILNKQNIELDIFDKARIESSFLLYKPDSIDACLLSPTGSPWHFVGLNRLRKNFLHYDKDSCICANINSCDSGSKILIYNNDKLVDAKSIGIKFN